MADETINRESEKKNETKSEGSGSIKQSVDVAAANRDERVAGIQPSPSPAVRIPHNSDEYFIFWTQNLEKWQSPISLIFYYFLFPTTLGHNFGSLFN